MDAQERPNGATEITTSTAEEVVYPLPEGTHAQVIADRELFDRALKRVHEYFGIADKVPRVGGRELDLYQLYCNVTALGGCSQVIAKKQWRDAAESFKYPDTITSVSYTLRKAYSQLLWDFEQIYYFQATGPRLAPPGAAPAATAATTSSSGGLSGQPGDSGGQITAAARIGGKRRRSNDLDAAAFPQLPFGCPLQLVAACRGGGSTESHAVGAKGTVTLDARFDCGYFVTVHVGCQEFQGMLYYPPQESAEALLAAPSRQQAAGLSSADEDRGRKGSAKGRDPNAPKPNQTPFNFFSAEARPKAKAAFPDLPQSEITKKVGEMWQSAGEEEKAPFKAMAQADKDRYLGELEAHNYRLAAQAAQAQAQSAAQQVASLASQQQPAAPLQLPLVAGGHPAAALGMYPLAMGQLPGMAPQLPHQQLPFLQQLPQPQQMLLQNSAPMVHPAPQTVPAPINVPSIIEGWRPPALNRGQL